MTRGEVIASSADLSAENHIAVAEIVAERARRLIECGKHVIIFLDSITRMARAYNHMQKGGGKIMSGGIDARTMEKPRRFFGAARNAEGGGSLTIVATALVDTGSRMDEIIFQEFKGTGNTEIVLDRDLFNRRIFPCINIPQSGTRKEEKLYEPEDLPKIVKLRRALAAVDKIQAMELVLGRLSKFKTNADVPEELLRRPRDRAPPVPWARRSPGRSFATKGAAMLASSPARTLGPGATRQGAREPNSGNVRRPRSPRVSSDAPRRLAGPPRRSW